MIKSLDHLGDEVNKGNQIEILKDGRWVWFRDEEMLVTTYADLIGMINNIHLKVKQVKG